MRLTRREVVRVGVSAATSLVWPGGFSRAQTMGPILRPIPSSGERLPVIGLGARNYRVGELVSQRAPFKATLDAFVSAGGKLIDTAPSYGNSERVIGELVAELGVRRQLFLATKVDQEGRDAALERLENSFSDLHGDPLDLIQIHNLKGVDTQLAILRDLKARGRIRYLGITTSFEHQYQDLLALMERETLDFIQVDYALDNRNAADHILPLAADRGMAVLINLPFGRGRLFRAVEGTPLPDWAADIDCTSWGQVFLKYVISHPVVTCAIPGTTKVDHALDNQAAGRGRLPDNTMRRMMEGFIDGLSPG